MELHLYWIDRKWKAEQRTVNNYNLLVDVENKTYKIFVNPYLAYHRATDIEVKRKSDITDYVKYLKIIGFVEEVS